MPLSLGPEGRLFLGMNVILTLSSQIDYYAVLPGIPSPCWGCRSVPLAAVMIGFNNLLDKNLESSSRCVSSHACWDY